MEFSLDVRKPACVKGNRSRVNLTPTGRMPGPAASALFFGRIGDAATVSLEEETGCPSIREQALSSETSPERCASTAGFVAGFITAED